MIPLKPKFKDTYKMELRVNERTLEILKQYSKYLSRDVNEIVDELAPVILETDKEFVKWLTTRRYDKKIRERIF